MKNLFKILVVCLLIVSFLGCTSSKKQPQSIINVSAAASLTDVVSAIAAAYEKETGQKIQLNFASSSVLAKQIEEGYRADIYLSANPKWAKYVEEKGLVVPETMTTLLKNSLAIIIPKGSKLSISSVNDLTAPEIKKIAIGDPSHVPAGIYARQALEAAGIWKTVQDKTVGAVDVRAAMAFVENNAVDCGIVYKTDALVSDKVILAYELPVEITPEIRYVACMIKSERPDAGQAQQFFDFLRSAQARSLYEQYGFTPAWDN